MAMNFIKKTISSFIILFLITGIAFAQSVDLVASVDENPPFSNGQTFNYSILSTGNPYNSLRLKIVYNPSVLQLNSLTPVYTFDLTPVNDTSTPGLIKFEAADLGSNITTDEIILNIEFEVLDNNQTISIAHNYDAADGTVVVNASGNDILGTANDILLETLSTQNNDLNTLLSVYPNPANNEVLISLGTSNLQISNVSFYSIDGKLVLTKTFSDYQLNNSVINIDTTQLKNALYFMNITDNKGNKRIFKLLVSH